jgi:hypothetical protein
MNDDPIDALYPDDAPGGPAVDGFEAKPAGDPTAEPETAFPAPERYELKLEGLTLDPKLLAEAEPVFREMGLSNKQANALLPIAPKLMASAQEQVIQKLIDEGSKQRNAWLEAFNNDRELGGANRSESARLAQLGLEKMGIGKDHPFRAALNETGFGNHPDMIRILRWVGSTAAQGGRGGARSVPAWKAMYPDG